MVRIFSKVSELADRQCDFMKINAQISRDSVTHFLRLAAIELLF